MMLNGAVEGFRVVSEYVIISLVSATNLVNLIQA